VGWWNVCGPLMPKNLDAEKPWVQRTAVGSFRCGSSHQRKKLGHLQALAARRAVLRRMRSGEATGLISSAQGAVVWDDPLKPLVELGWATLKHHGKHLGRGFVGLRFLDHHLVVSCGHLSEGLVELLAGHVAHIHGANTASKEEAAPQTILKTAHTVSGWAFIQASKKFAAGDFRPGTSSRRS